MTDAAVRVLLIGQTPPPYGGQALSLATLVHGTYRDVRMFHLRMAFSRALSEVGRFQLRKLAHFIKLLAMLPYMMMRTRPHVVHYPPSNGSSAMPFLRDVLLLGFLRAAFPRCRILFTFNAAGLSEYLAAHPEMLRGLRGTMVRRALFQPDTAVQLSRFNPADGEFLQARRTVIMPDGVRDEAGPSAPDRSRHDRNMPTILYMGVLRHDKGIDDLLEASSLLHNRGVGHRLICVGEFVSPEYEKACRRYVSERGLSNMVHFPGVLTGEHKRQAYRDADLFIYPTFADFESLGRVVIEAMSFSLPVVATRWRGVQDVVQDGVTGNLAPPRQPAKLAAAIERFLLDPQLRVRCGQAGRTRYESMYSEEMMVRCYETLYIETAHQER